MGAEHAPPVTPSSLGKHSREPSISDKTRTRAPRPDSTPCRIWSEHNNACGLGLHISNSVTLKVEPTFVSAWVTDQKLKSQPPHFMVRIFVLRSLDSINTTDTPKKSFSTLGRSPWSPRSGFLCMRVPDRKSLPELLHHYFHHAQKKKLYSLNKGVIACVRIGRPLGP